MSYTQEGKSHIDIIPIESKIRAKVIGIKSHESSWSPFNAQCSAMVYSFLISCRVNNFNQEEWLEDVPRKINSTKEYYLTSAIFIAENS